MSSLKAFDEDIREKLNLQANNIVVVLLVKTDESCYYWSLF